MNRKIIVLFSLVIITLIVSGCTQNNSEYEKEEFTENNIQLLEIDFGDYSEIIKTRNEIDDRICAECNNPDIYPGECIASPTLRFNIKAPKGYVVDDEGYIRDLYCKFYVNGKDIYEYGEHLGSIREGINTGQISIGLKIRYDEKLTIDICCENICESKSIPALC